MTNLLKRISRPATLGAMTAAGLLVALTAAPSASAATDVPAPECVQSYQSWRYTDVFNGCGETVAVTAEYTNGQSAPCRVLAPGAWATFAGYGTDGNYVTGLRSCDPLATSGA
ncbi:alpha-amylase [Streptomyces sp. A0642]|uniref:alpha-amylase n=1 Tax=Streptomyces sp. A0642 TaxID=2563100 RepID=UPI001F0E934B|nr:alpha-amylase [Streptomyces sp. A0642]